jgi:hypothetical protein
MLMSSKLTCSVQPCLDMQQRGDAVSATPFVRVGNAVGARGLSFTKYDKTGDP